MTCKLDNEDRGILTFRPNIAFVEPDQQPGVIDGIDYPQFEDVQAGRQRIKKLAEAVNKLATATQARVDQRAKGIVIELNRDADQDAIQAMRRRFPDDDPTKITYEQYRACRNGVIGKGVSIGDQAVVSADQVKSARDTLSTGRFAPGGYGTKEAENGGLRPENDGQGQIIPPINIEEVQINLICILVNFIWKNFIKKIIVNSAGIPVGLAFKALPDQICDPGADIQIPGLLILGDEPDDLLSGKVATQAQGLIDNATATTGGG